MKRNLPIGAELTKEGANFRVWAPRCQKIEIFFENGDIHPLSQEKGGYFSGTIKGVKAGTLYRYRLDEKDLLPDPASRFQPLGPHGPSQVIDIDKFKWTDSNWKGIIEKDKVIIYELHIGTFTEEGTWASAVAKLPYLKELGITIIEMMPVSEWAGSFNWGYDGVDLYAPTHHYGHPDDLKNFVNEAHRHGLGVILDVVYNHFGPDGNYLSKFSDHYFKNEKTEWGDAINFDGFGKEGVREFFIENAGYWIEEFHFDGLRLDACHSIEDASHPHIITEVTRKVREKGGRKGTYVIAENEKQQAHFVLPEKKGGFGLDAVWNEDFHHAAFVRLTGRDEAYFSDYTGSAQEFLSSIKYNFLYQGQWYSWQKKGRGSPALDIPHECFVNFLENHDQIANTGDAWHLHWQSNDKSYKALAALLLLSPQIPLLFQGQEFGATSSFYYFCEHHPELAEKVYAGRLEFMCQFKRILHPVVKKEIPPPHEKSTFLKCKIKWEEKEKNKTHYQLYKDLIELRKNDPVFSNFKEVKIEGSVPHEDVLILRFFSENGERLLLLNFGKNYELKPASEPLLAPPSGFKWQHLLSTEEPKYGGFGFLEIPEKENWILSSFSTAILYAEKVEYGQ